MSTTTQCAAALTSFPFVSHSIRACLIDGHPWFVARDVFTALDIKWNGANSLTKIKAEWKGVSKLNTPSEDGTGRGGGEQELLIIKEPAVYKIAFRSDKPEAEAFTDRIAEIVETIRKTGRYDARTSAPTSNPREASEEFTPQDMQNLTRLVWLVTRGMRHEGRFSQAIWFLLRQKTATPSRISR